MFYKNLITQKTFNPWHFIWITVVVSELLTAFLTFMQYSLFLKSNLPHLLIVGAVDALFVPLMVVPIIVYFTRKSAEIQKHNELLQQEIAARKQMEEALRHSETLYHDLVETAQDLIWQ